VGVSPGRALPILASVALALAAQYLFTGELLTVTRDTNTWEWLPRYSWASALLLLAVAVAALAFRGDGGGAGAVGAPAWTAATR